MNRKERRAQQAIDGSLSSTEFVEISNKFIDVANRQNSTVKASQLHMAFLFGSARYSAFFAKNIAKAENHEEFVDHMVKQYTEMLRQHLADPSV